VQALLSSLCAFSHLLERVSNQSLRTLVAGYLPGYTPRQMTHDLRRLRRNGLLARVEHSNHYTLTTDGRKLGVSFSKTYARIVTPSLAELDPAPPEHIATNSPPARTWRSFEHALDARIADAALAA
jgi:hypothetical protein